MKRETANKNLATLIRFFENGWEGEIKPIDLLVTTGILFRELNIDAETGRVRLSYLGPLSGVAFYQEDAFRAFFQLDDGELYQLSPFRRPLTVGEFVAAGRRILKARGYGRYQRFFKALRKKLFATV